MESYDVKRIFAERLKALRNEQNLSQTKLAKDLDVSHGSVNYYENAERMAGIDFIYKAANYFGCCADYLLGLSEFRNEKEKDEYGVLNDFFDEKLADLNHHSRSKLIFALSSFIDAEAKATGYDRISNSDNNEYFGNNYKYLQEVSALINEYAILLQRLIATHKYLTDKEDTFSKSRDGTYNEITHTAIYFFRLKEHVDKINKINGDLVNSLFDVMLHEYENLL